MPPKDLNLQVRYLAATKPFVDPHASATETLATLKSRVLEAFELQEIQDANQSILYFLYRDDQKLEDLSQTLGALAGDSHLLKLRLVQQIIQGEGAASLDAKCFEADLAEVEKTEEAGRWQIQAVGLQVTVGLRSAKDKANETYVARLSWDRYPANPPSLKFLDAHGGDGDPRAWPMCANFRPGSLDACVNWTREGFVTHPEWLQSPAARWNPRGNVLFRALNLLQDALDFTYNGRHHQ